MGSDGKGNTYHDSQSLWNVCVQTRSWQVLENVHSIVIKFATNIENIFSNPDIIKIKSAATLDAAENNTWSRRIEIFGNIYNNAIKNHNDIYFQL